VFGGGGIALCGILSGANGLAFAIGVYLPLSTMAPLYLGGCVRAVVEHFRQGKPVSESDAGVLAASGLVAGEGLAGVLVAGLVAAGWAPKTRLPLCGGLSGQAGIAVVTLLICIFLWRSCRAR
jgi:uncharacterized oligopeptide transporter (OPT) family protein